MKTYVLYVSRYAMTDRNGGGQVAGAKVTYLDDQSVNKKDAMGQAALTVNCDYKFFNAFRGYKIPGHFDIDFSARPDSRGRPVLSISSVRPCPESERSVTVPDDDGDSLSMYENQIERELEEIG